MKKRVLGGFLSLAMLITSSLAFDVVGVKAASNMVVDCNSVIREATHCASGSLYGITENTPGNINDLVAPLHPYVVRNPARGANGNQHPFGDAIKVAKRLSSVPGAKVSIDLADMLPYWPYQWPGMNSWLNQVRSFANDKKSSGCSNWYGYEIWNEPDGTWKNQNGSFEEMWRQTYNVLRSVDPGEKIIGPCISWYNESYIRNFLNYCKNNNCLPDIISWHELSGIEGVSSHLRSYRNLERQLGIRELPISINEYCDAKHELEGQPGSSARFIGKFERYKVDSAMITWWFVPNPGRLGSLMATDTQKGAGWYFYKWYGDMTGNMVNVTPPNDDSALVDGAACVDNNKKYVSFIFGGPNDGTINTTFRNIPSFIGSKANVTIEKIDWVSKDTVSYGPQKISSQTMNVVNGQLSVSVSGCNSSSGYRIYITEAGNNDNNGGQQGNNGGQQGNNGGQQGYNNQSQGSSNIEAGRTYKLINRNSSKALAVSGDDTRENANIIQWSDNGKTSQQWRVVDKGNGYALINVNANKALDIEKSSTSNGGNALLWFDNGQNNQKWYIKSTNDGYFILENVNSGKVLDVEGKSYNDGGNVIQWDNNNGANQQWKFVRVD